MVFRRINYRKNTVEMTLFQKNEVCHQQQVLLLYFEIIIVFLNSKTCCQFFPVFIPFAFAPNSYAFCELNNIKFILNAIIFI